MNDDNTTAFLVGALIGDLISDSSGSSCDSTSSNNSNSSSRNNGGYDFDDYSPPKPKYDHSAATREDAHFHKASVLRLLKEYPTERVRVLELADRFAILTIREYKFALWKSMDDFFPIKSIYHWLKSPEGWCQTRRTIFWGLYKYVKYHDLDYNRIRHIAGIFACNLNNEILDRGHNHFYRRNGERKTRKLLIDLIVSYFRE